MTGSTILKRNLLMQPCEHYEGANVSNVIRSQSSHILGFEFDGTACFRKGTVNGPNACRAVSDGIETYSFYLDLDTEDLPSFYDLGNLPARDESNTQDWQRATDHLLSLFDMNFKDTGVRTLLIGVEHSVSYAPIRRYLECFPDLVLLHLDAHADLRDGYPVQN